MSNGSGEENRNGKALGSSAAVGKNGDPFGIEVVAVNDIPADVGPEEIGRITYYRVLTASVRKRPLRQFYLG